MTIDATSFVMTSGDPESLALRGFGLIAIEARYSSVLCVGSERIERRFAQPTVWRAVKLECDGRFRPKPLERDSAIVRLLSVDRGLTVSWLSLEAVTAERADDVAAALDFKLREIAGRAGLVEPAHGPM